MGGCHFGVRHCARKNRTSRKRTEQAQQKAGVLKKKAKGMRGTAHHSRLKGLKVEGGVFPKNFRSWSFKGRFEENRRYIEFCEKSHRKVRRWKDSMGVAGWRDGKRKQGTSFFFNSSLRIYYLLGELGWKPKRAKPKCLEAVLQEQQFQLPEVPQ